MKRVIKFRGKRPDGSWNYGRSIIFKQSSAVLIKGAKVDPDTVGQFTGLCDCNGREIYEGDVIKSMYNDIYHVIGYNESRGAFTATLINEYMNNTDGLKTECNAEQKWLADCKKIIAGNMFDTPSLLKGGKP